MKGDKFSIKQCPQTDVKSSFVSHVPYASAIERLMYAQVYIMSNIAFIVNVFGHYLSNSGTDH